MKYAIALRQKGHQDRYLVNFGGEITLDSDCLGNAVLFDKRAAKPTAKALKAKHPETIARIVKWKPDQSQWEANL